MLTEQGLESVDSSPGGAEISAMLGRDQGIRDGYSEGYLRGRASAIVGQNRPAPPLRQIKVLYVASGKGYPYSPIDEAVSSTLRSMVSELIICDTRQSVNELAAFHRPDLVLVLDGMELPVEQIQAIRTLGIRSAIWLTDDPYYTDISVQITPYYDYVFTLERNCIDFYRSAGCSNVHYLPFAAYLDHYQPTLTRSPIRRELSFIGSAYWNRLQYLSPVMGELLAKGMFINGIWWDRLPEYAAYPNQIEVGKWMEPKETAQVYSGTKIVLNLHRSPFDEVNNNSLGIPGASPNPRTFEISACGTLQLVDAREDLASFYVPGQEIETFTTPEELVEKVNYYIAHENERQEIALRALERTYQSHTYSHRLDELLRTIFG